VWQQGGLFYFEPAEDHGEAFWVDHLGRIGVDQDDGVVIWHEIHDGRVYAKERSNPDDAMIELKHTRIHGVMGSPNLPGMTKIGAALVLFVTLFVSACGDRVPLEDCPPPDAGADVVPEEKPEPKPWTSAQPLCDESPGLAGINCGVTVNGKPCAECVRDTKPVGRCYWSAWDVYCAPSCSDCPWGGREAGKGDTVPHGEAEEGREPRGGEGRPRVREGDRGRDRAEDGGASSTHHARGASMKGPTKGFAVLDPATGIAWTWTGVDWETKGPAETGANELRKVAKWCDGINESVLDKYTAEELLRLFRIARASDWDFTIDRWTDRQRWQALHEDKVPRWDKDEKPVEQ
jgi:hypothetical protein